MIHLRILAFFLWNLAEICGFWGGGMLDKKKYLTATFGIGGTAGDYLTLETEPRFLEKKKITLPEALFEQYNSEFFFARDFGTPRFQLRCTLVDF